MPVKYIQALKECLLVPKHSVYAQHNQSVIVISAY